MGADSARGSAGRCLEGGGRVRSANQDARLAERALREGWPVPADRRAGLVAVLVELAESPATRPRERISAVRALLGASSLNLEALRVSMVAGEYEALMGRLSALGAVPTAVLGTPSGGGGEGPSAASDGLQMGDGGGI